MAWITPRWPLPWPTWLDHPNVAKTLGSLGNAEGSLGNPTRKKELLERALKFEEGFYGLDHPNVAITLANLGNAETLGSLGNAEGSLGNPTRKKELLERALKFEEGFYGLDHPEVAITLTNLGNAEGLLGNPTRKKELLERALKIEEGFYGLDHPEVASTLTNLGWSELLLHQYVSGKKNVERATGIFVKHCGQSHPHTVKAQQMMSLLESVEASP